MDSGSENKRYPTVYTTVSNGPLARNGGEEKSSQGAFLGALTAVFEQQDQSVKQTFLQIRGKLPSKEDLFEYWQAVSVSSEFWVSFSMASLIVL